MYEPWLPRCAPMGADVGIFQVAYAPTYGYVYLIPISSTVKKTNIFLTVNKIVVSIT